MFVQVLSSVWQYASEYVHSSRYTQTAALREGKEKKRGRKEEREEVVILFYFKFSA